MKIDPKGLGHVNENIDSMEVTPFTLSRSHIMVQFDDSLLTMDN